MDKNNKEFNLYQDINKRTNGEIYIGVVGPVRSGKSTFIKNFAKKLIIPNIKDEEAKVRTTDELPQSAAGRTVMTTEPKFIPRESIVISPMEDISLKVRLVDCVGFMIDGANGVMEEGHERLVRTPWYEYEVPFGEAADFGTKKVIKDHSTVGIVMTSDGSFGEIVRESYVPAEEKAINELKNIGKPFIVILNTAIPDDSKTLELTESMKEKYDTEVLPLNCEKLSLNNINSVLEAILMSFPVSDIEFYFNDWLLTLDENNPIKQDISKTCRSILDKITCIKDFNKDILKTESQYITDIRNDQIDMSDGVLKIYIETDEQLYYDMLSNIAGEKIDDERGLINLIKEYSSTRKSLDKYMDSINCVKAKGYSVITPCRDEINISEPEIIKNGGRYGVKIKAESPSYHMIKVNIGTEIAPIVGSETQAEDLKKYITDSSKKEDAWNINIFGKTIEQLVEDGISTKLAMMNDDCQAKLMDTMQKVVNDNSGGLICLII